MATLATLPSSSQAINYKSRTDGYAVQKTDTEWKNQLSSAQYDILRMGGTERPYSSILEGEERPGIYKCAGCGTPLFESSQKFHSGTGWPSFATGLAGVEVEDVNPVMAGLAGAELRCKTCGGHLGDVFQDGFLFVGTPAFVSGKRYCIDGAALVFEPSNGEATVAGDLSPPRKLPGWLEPPQITPRS
jgi:peptide-methionine (R)-S-oxide reductase